MKMNLVMGMLVLMLALTSCTSIRDTTLQISGQETITEWQSIGVSCQSTQECIDQALEQGASLDEVEGRTRCDQNECEWRIERNIKTEELA